MEKVHKFIEPKGGVLTLKMYNKSDADYMRQRFHYTDEESALEDYLNYLMQEVESVEARLDKLR